MCEQDEQHQTMIIEDESVARLNSIFIIEHRALRTRTYSDEINVCGKQLTYIRSTSHLFMCFHYKQKWKFLSSAGLRVNIFVFGKVRERRKCMVDFNCILTSIDRCNHFVEEKHEKLFLRRDHYDNNRKLLTLKKRPSPKHVEHAIEFPHCLATAHIT